MRIVVTQKSGRKFFFYPRNKSELESRLAYISRSFNMATTSVVVTGP